MRKRPMMRCTTTRTTATTTHVSAWRTWVSQSCPIWYVSASLRFLPSSLSNIFVRWQYTTSNLCEPSSLIAPCPLTRLRVISLLGKFICYQTRHFRVAIHDLPVASPSFDCSPRSCQTSAIVSVWFSCILKLNYLTETRLLWTTSTRVPLGYYPVPATNMSDPTPASETVVPIKITQPEGNAPPTLAEPASGPVAEMSGAIQQEEKPATEPVSAESEY